MKEIYLVMHMIAVRKYGTADQLHALLDLPPERIDALLDEIVAGGRAARANDRYVLTPAGQVTLRSSYAKSCAALRNDPAFMAAYEDFEALNTDLKQTITDWQTLSVGGQKVPNDHSDQAYDERVIDRLGHVHDKLDRVMARLSQAEPRLESYGRRLLTALEKAEDGEIQWVSDATLDSYHTVWFELHEDLLRLAGRERQE